MDLIVFPEMALIGYRFDDRDDITPYTETVPANINELVGQIESGEEQKEEDLPCSFKWALRISKRFGAAWVVCGFAERDSEDRFHNSALLVNHQLRQCHVVRKTLLYDDDKKWAVVEASVSGIEYNFQNRNLMFPRLQKEIKCGIGICMDINFRDFDMDLANTTVLADH